MRFPRFIITSLVLVSAFVWADDDDYDDSCIGPRPDRVSVRHIEPGGIGYQHGYTSVDFFLSAREKWPRIRPFLDLRGHVFNTGRFAANAGLGLRGLASSIETVFGLNAFYDYRQTKRRPYNQVSGGFEVLREGWDFRANGYFPVGIKETRYYDYSFSFNPSNNNLHVSAVRQFVMKGFDAEFGWHAPKVKWVEFYPAAGCYYYRSSSNVGIHTFGGRVRLLATVIDWVTLEGIVSYDHRFKWVGQGALAINIPFGGRIEGRKYTMSYDVAEIMQDRMVQPVWHNEIIVKDTHRQSVN